jgi:hypothetical protein
MSTIATATMTDLAHRWAGLYKSAKISGIVGDPAHQARGGYHIGRAFQSSSNYSVTRPDDRVGPADAAAAIDMTLSPADMVTCTGRLMAAYNNTSDPRRKYVNAVNGWDGSGDATRFDIYARKTKYASPDHKWHIHLELRRKYVNAKVAADAVISLLSGESVAAYLKRIGVISTVAKVTPSPAKLAAPAYPGHVLRRDDNMKPNSDLVKWQARMIARGWKSIGSADGRFGARTELVVRRFQTICKLQSDGVIGERTWPQPWVRPLGS